MEIVITNNIQEKSTDILNSITHLLEHEPLCSIGSVNDDGSPHINTCYFASDNNMQLYVLTPPNTKHSINFKSNNRVAINLFQKEQIFGEKIWGVQLFGVAKKIELVSSLEAFKVYSNKFKIFKEWFPSISNIHGKIQSRFYMITVNKGKLIDEKKFGDEKYIEFKVVRK